MGERLLSRARDRRHACALRTLEATRDVRQIAFWLGHASRQTTEVYLRVDAVEKLEILSKQQPPAVCGGSFNGVQDELLAMLAEFTGGPEPEPGPSLDP